ncbi:MAG: OsmC family protein [Chloroflexi bacterium]|nr:OsmC family protein [Chloroflexota bacterium]
MADKKTGRAIWRDDLMFTGISGTGFTVPLDAAKTAGGHGTGVGPMDLLLVALAGCTGMDVISILRKKQQDITGFEVQVEGLRADEHPRTWKEIWVKFVVTGHNVDPAAVERAIELSRDKYCGVSATLKPITAMNYSQEIIEAEPEA